MMTLLGGATPTEGAQTPRWAACCPEKSRVPERQLGAVDEDCLDHVKLLEHSSGACKPLEPDPEPAKLNPKSQT